MPKYNQPRKTWQYTKDFKIKAVKLSHQDGIQVKKVATVSGGTTSERFGFIQRY